MTKQFKSVRTLTVTLFSNCMAPTGVAFNMYNWLFNIKNGTYKAAVEEIRRLTAEGEDEKAALIKRNLPAICPCGFLPKGRTEKSPMELNSLMWIDYDVHDKATSEKARDILKGQKGILAMYLTARNGLRIIGKMPDDTTIDTFPLYCEVVYHAIDKLTGLKHDPQATTRTHLCSASYDPDTWYVQPNEITDFPIQQMLKENQEELYKELEYKAEHPEEVQEVDDGISLEEELDEAILLAYRQDKNEFSGAQIDHMFTCFVEDNPLLPGLRNKNLLRLGQRAYYKRMSKKELEYLIEASYDMIHDREYDKKRIRECISWGYRHCDKQEICKTDSGYEGADGMGESDSQFSRFSRFSHPIGGFAQEPLKLSDCQGDYSLIVEKNCPLFPDSVYENLPPFLKNLVFKSKNRRYDDMALMGNIAALSGLMPKVSTRVKDEDYWANLFFIAIAPAGSGKSIVSKSRNLFTYVKTKFTYQNNQRKKECEQAKARWELEKKLADKEKRVRNTDLEPAEFVEKVLIHPSQTSRSALIHSIAHNPNGITLFATELDTLNESLNCDYGKHSAELRCLASNEPIESKYVNDTQTYEQEKPCGTLVATGTPEQLVSFIGNTHDGMESRCLIMLANTFPDWISWSGFDEEKGSEKKQAYQDAAKELVHIYEFLESHPTHVTIPRELRARCDAYFDRFTKCLIRNEYENLRCIVNRCPIHIARICAILASLRKYEMGYEGIEVQATEEDMNVALGIVLTLLKHSCLATTMFVNDGKKMNALKNIFTEEEIFNNLEDKFTCTDAVKEMMIKMKHSKSATYRIIERWRDEKFIKKLGNRYYVKTGKQMVEY